MAYDELRCQTAECHLYLELAVGVAGRAIKEPSDQDQPEAVQDYAANQKEDAGSHQQESHGAPVPCGAACRAHQRSDRRIPAASDHPEFVPWIPGVARSMKKHHRRQRAWSLTRE